MGEEIPLPPPAAFAAKEGPVLSRVRGLGMQRSRSCQTLLFKKPALLR